MFWNSGLTKIASWQTTVALFRDEYQVPLLPPEVAAVFGTTFELGCPLFIVLGLGFWAIATMAWPGVYESVLFYASMRHFRRMVRRKAELPDVMFEQGHGV